MADVENMLNDDEFFGDINTPKDGIEQHKKRECLKSVIGQSLVIIGSKWTQEKVDKTSGETIDKTYTEYKLRELNEKGEKIGKGLGKHVISLYSNGIYRVVKIRDVKKLQQNFENDLIINNQMANLGCLLVCTFGNFLAPVLVAAHTVNNLDIDHELENKGYESE